MSQQPQSPISNDQRTLSEHQTEVKQQRSTFWTDFFSFLDKPAEWIDSIIYKAKHIPETNFAIASAMADEGNFDDAILRLKITLWFAPNHPGAHYILGCSYISLGDEVRAKDALLKALELNPVDENIHFMLATLDPSSIPADVQPVKMPYNIAQEYFRNNAANYEFSQLDAGYRGHQLADEAVWDALDRRRVNYQVLELGCGTGLTGTLLAEHAEELVGVDFCKEMLDIAKSKRRPDNRRVYTEALLMDLRHYLADITKPRFDAVVAAHVFNYVGDVTAQFDAIALSLKPGGVFVCQVERFADDERFGLIPGLGRFGHGDHYMRGHMARVGLEVLSNDVVRVYPDYELIQYVARKPE